MPIDPGSPGKIFMSHSAQKRIAEEDYKDIVSILAIAFLGKKLLQLYYSG